jgi:hypothetical protein
LRPLVGKVLGTSVVLDAYMAAWLFGKRQLVLGAELSDRLGQCVEVYLLPLGAATLLPGAHSWGDRASGWRR